LFQTGRDIPVGIQRKESRDASFTLSLRNELENKLKCFCLIFNIEVDHYLFALDKMFVLKVNQ
jgi:hypothetical protein